MERPILIDTDKQVTAAKSKKDRERIQAIETKPTAEWFQLATDSCGRRIWFLRMQVTGLRTRRYGPFQNKRTALLFLDHVLGQVNGGLIEAANFIDDYQIVPRQFASRNGHYPIVEDELTGPRVEKRIRARKTKRQ